MKQIAIVFPGQGSQFVGMGQALFKGFALARETYAEVSEAIGWDVAKLCQEGPAEQLELTEFTQPCVLTSSLAAWRVLEKETGLRPAMAAGHSLGEYSALVATGALALADAARAVHNRGKWMQSAAPAGEGGMAAVMGLSRELVKIFCEEAAQGEVLVPSNDNSPEQIVISGRTAALDRAIAIIKDRGGKVRKLKVSAPFHTPLMKPAAEKMAGFLRGLRFSAPSCPVIANVDALPYPGPEAMADLLTRQIVSPVRWRECVERLDREGIKLYLECGPGVLSGLIRKTLPSPMVFSMDEPEDLAMIGKALTHDQ